MFDLGQEKDTPAPRMVRLRDRAELMETYPACPDLRNYLAINGGDVECTE